MNKVAKKKIIHFKEDNHSFTIRFNDRIILTHSLKTPLIKIGNTNPDFRMNPKMIAYYRLKNKIKEITPLITYHINHVSPTLIDIQFENILTLSIELIAERLVLTPKIHNISEKEKPPPFSFFQIRLSATEKEAIYGCGEHFSFLNLRNRKFPLWTQEPGIAKKKFSLIKYLADAVMGAGGEWWTTYFPQPTFISSDNYFVHVESYAYAEFDFTHSDYHLLSFNEIPQKMVIDVGETAIQTISSLTSLLGRQRPLPGWVFDGVWLGIIGGLHSNNSQSIPAKLHLAETANAKIAAIWAEDWTGLREFKAQTRLFWNWKYSHELYPKLPEYINTLHNKGIHFLGYNNCFLMKDGEMHEYAKKHGYLVHKEDGTIYDLPMFSFSAPMLDLTNPEAVNWFKEQIKEHMIEIGLDGWMCDFAEYLPVNAKLYDGRDPLIHHNEYPVLWAKLNADAIQEAGRDQGEDAIVFFSRSGNYRSTQYSPLIWAGDQVMRFWLEMGLAAQITSALSLGFVGVGFSHADIAGEFRLLWIKRTKELFMRGTEFAAFSPVMRTHEAKGHSGWSWYSDDETMDHFAQFSRIHALLKPYFLHLVKEYQITGLPMIRHPYLHYENELVLHEQHPRLLQYQYLLGSDLFVAPVYKKGKKQRKLYLPSDTWVHVWSGETFNGGWITVESPLGKPPVFYRMESKFAELFKEIIDK